MSSEQLPWIYRGYEAYVMPVCEVEVPTEKAQQNYYREFIKARQGYLIREVEMPVWKVAVPKEKALQNNYREFIDAQESYVIAEAAMQVKICESDVKSLCKAIISVLQYLGH